MYVEKSSRSMRADNPAQLIFRDIPSYDLVEDIRPKDIRLGK